LLPAALIAIAQLRLPATIARKMGGDHEPFIGRPVHAGPKTQIMPRDTPPGKLIFLPCPESLFFMPPLAYAFWPLK